MKVVQNKYYNKQNIEPKKEKNDPDWSDILNLGKYIISLFLIGSLILNVVLYKNINSFDEANKIETNEILTSKEQEIENLNNEIDTLETELVNSTLENREDYSNTIVEKQNIFIDGANKFIERYFNYSSNDMADRREKLMEITSPDIIDHVAPKPIENPEEQLSSDPTFVSELQSVDFYLSRINESNNTAEAVARITYLGSNTEGESTVNGIVRLQLELSSVDSNEVIINEYDYSPIR